MCRFNFLVSFGVLLNFFDRMMNVFMIFVCFGLGILIMVVLLMVGCLISVFFMLNGLIWQLDDVIMLFVWLMKFMVLFGFSLMLLLVWQQLFVIVGVFCCQQLWNYSSGECVMLIVRLLGLLGLSLWLVLLSIVIWQFGIVRLVELVWMMCVRL